MQGFVASRKTYELTFDEGAEYSGLNVTMTGLSLGDILTVQSAQTQRDTESVVKVFNLFADNLVCWNVVRPDGTPIPPTFDGVREQEMRFLLAIMNSWISAVSEVPGPLDGSSTTSQLSPEESLPMTLVS